MKVTIYDANELATAVKFAKKVFVYSAIFEDHIRTQKGEFIEQLHFMAQDGVELPKPVLVDLDQHGFMWID